MTRLDHKRYAGGLEVTRCCAYLMEGKRVGRQAASQKLEVTGVLVYWYVHTRS